MADGELGLSVGFFVFDAKPRTAALCRFRGRPAGVSPTSKRTRNRADFAGFSALEKIFINLRQGRCYSWTITASCVPFLERERPARGAKRKPKKRNKKMSEKETYGAQAIAEDLENLGEEIATDTEMTLTETKPEDFDHDEWKALREAIKAMREKLDAMEEMIDRAETEAEEYDEDAAEDRYETYWA